METINRTNIGEHLLVYQLEMVNKTLKDVANDDKWFFNITMTRNQAIQFRSYAIPLIKKTFKCNRVKAEGIFEWFNLTFGLRIKG